MPDKIRFPISRMNLRDTAAYLGFILVILLPGRIEATQLFTATLKNGDYGSGFPVGAYEVGNPWNDSGSTGGDLSQLGIVDSASGATFTTNHDVINYSLGAAGYNRATFRATGTVSFWFRAESATFVGGQPLVENFGFAKFATGQASFGTSMSRDLGGDGISGTSDDTIEFGWSTLHGTSWYSHITANEVRLEFGRWHNIGFAWGGASNDFEMWVNASLAAVNDLPGGAPQAWGASADSAYNIALGEIHERWHPDQDNSARVVTFSDIQIWDEYRLNGATVVPEPCSIIVFAGALGFLSLRRRRTNS